MPRKKKMPDYAGYDRAHAINASRLSPLLGDVYVEVHQPSVQGGQMMTFMAKLVLPEGAKVLVAPHVLEDSMSGETIIENTTFWRQDPGQLGAAGNLMPFNRTFEEFVEDPITQERLRLARDAAKRRSLGSVRGDFENWLNLKRKLDQVAELKERETDPFRQLSYGEATAKGTADLAKLEATFQNAARAFEDRWGRMDGREPMAEFVKRGPAAEATPEK